MAFEQFGNEVVADDKKNESLGYEFTFDGDELQQADRPSLFRAIAPGEYDFTVDDLHYEKTKKSGDNMVRITFSVEAPDGEVRVDDYFVCTAKNKWKFAAFFAAIAQWDLVREKGITREIWDATLGMKGRFKIKNEEFNGKLQNHVEKYIAPGTAAVR